MDGKGAILNFSLKCGNIVKEDNYGTSSFDFSRLPWVVFLSILKFLRTNELCQYCLVNKLWHKACRDPSLWRYLDFAKYCNISSQDLVRLTSYSNNVALLRISKCDLLTDSGISTALIQCRSLVECRIVNCRELSDEVLTSLSECCHFLRILDITLSLGFTDNGIRKVCEGCPRMEEITIDQCSYLTDESLLHLGRYSRHLKCISASNIMNITDTGVAMLLRGCQQLKTLHMPFCKLTSQSVSHIVEHSTQIEALDIRGVHLEDNDVHKMITSLTEIESLNLGLCHNLTDVSVTEIGLYCKRLKHLILVQNKVTDEGLLQLSSNCASLLHLDISWNQNVTETGARYVLKNCPNLKHLGLFRCDRVSESAVNELTAEFPHTFISTLKSEMKKSLRSKADHDLT